MKRGTLVMTVLVVLAMLFASCSNGLSEKTDEGGASTKTVSVSLGVELEGEAAQKTIGTDTNLDGMTYWYKATHQWRQDRPVHGDTPDFVLIPKYSTGAIPASIGYFTAGTWLFEVEVRKGNDVIYSGDTTTTIYTGHTNIEVTVTPDDTGTGTINITVKVPTTGPQPAHQPAEAGDGEYHDSLIVYAEGVTPAITLTRGTVAAGLTTFTGSRGSLTPGAYTFRFVYSDESGTSTEGAAQAVTIFAGQTSNITGTIDGGKWHSSSIEISAPGITGYSLTAADDATSVAPSATLRYRCTAASAHGNDLTYEWFRDGTSVQGPNATNTYDFTWPSYGRYDITCSAIDATDGVIYSESLSVEVGYKVTPTAPITMGPYKPALQ